MENNVTITKLTNGLTVVTVHLPHFHSITNMLTVRSGSRYEDSSNHGVAHFLEHMGFKGTEHFQSSEQVAEAIEGVGGYSNAWTSVDHTAYWNTVPAKQYQIGIKMPFELVFRSLLRQKDMEREKGVIVEEIRRMHDNPADLVDDIAHETTFRGSTLGNSVIGTEQSVQALTIEQFKDYRDAYYNPAQSYFIAVGNLEGVGVISEVKKHLAGLEKAPVSKTEPFSGLSRSAVTLYKKDTDQAHFVLSVAAPSFAITHSNRFVGTVLSAILGSGMSSRLFTTIREQKGLAYSVYSSVSPFEETGAMSIYAGVNVEKIEVALQAIEEELEKLSSQKIGAAELTKAKNLVVGNFDIASDRPIELAVWYGISRMLGMTESREQARRQIEAVTAEQVQDLAKEIFAKQNQVLSIVGPYKGDERFKKIIGSS